jgi:hypothetical protein
MDNNNVISKSRKFKRKAGLAFFGMLSDSTSHGISQIVRKKKEKNWISFILWCLFFTASLSYCIYTVFNSIIFYLNYKVQTAVKNVQEIPSVFPGLTICNLNPFFEPVIKAVIDLPNIFECFDSKNGTEFEKCIGINDTRSGFDLLYNQLHRSVANNKTLSTIDLMNIGYQFRNDMLVSCKYNGKRCTACDFKFFWDYR